MTTQTLHRDAAAAAPLAPESERSLRTLLSRAPQPSNLLLLQIASLIFLAPCAILASKFLGLAGLSATLGSLGCAGVILTLRARPTGLLGARLDLRSLTGFTLLAAALMLLGGALHIFSPTPDWYVRDAVLADLSLHEFPVFYRVEDVDYFLRAPLGYYLTPALVGRVFGLYAAHVAAFVQNAALLAIILYFFAKIADAPTLVFAAVFLAFGWADQLIQIAFKLQDIQHWWNPLLFAYMSNISLLFWAPNHLLPAWWFAVLILLSARREVDLAVLGVSFAFLSLWSPLAMIGAAPFLLLQAARGSLRDLVSIRVFAGVAACLCLAAIGFYLTCDAASVEHRWLIGAEGFAVLYVAFIGVELPRAGLFYVAWSKIAAPDRPLILLSAAILCLIPFYSLGHFNDFAERACQTALAVVAFSFARLFCVTPRDGKAFSLAILTLTILTAFEGAFEIRYPLVTKSYPISDCNIVTAAKQQYPDFFPSHYLAKAAAAPAWLGRNDAPELRIEQKSCWPR